MTALTYCKSYEIHGRLGIYLDENIAYRIGAAFAAARKAENRPATAGSARASGADFGVAWDGDFDRCFFFDHTGSFIDGEYVVGLLAETFLAKGPRATDRL